MNTLVDRRVWTFLALATGAFFGLVALSVPVYAAVLVGALVAVIVLLPRMHVLVWLLFAAVLYEKSTYFLTLSALELTLSKQVVLLSIFVRGVVAVAKRDPFVRIQPFTLSFTVLLVVTVLGGAALGAPTGPYVGFVIRMVSLYALAHLVPMMLPARQLKTTLFVFAAGSFLSLLYVFGPTAYLDTGVELRYAGAVLDANAWCAVMFITTVPGLVVLSTKKSRWTPLLIVLVLALMYLNVFRTLSRSGLLVSVVMLPVLAVLIGRYRWVLAPALLCVLFFMGVLLDPEQLFERYSTLIDSDLAEQDGSLNIRASMAQHAIDIFRENWLFGIGPMGFREAVGGRTSGFSHHVAHNSYLTILAEQGVVGAAVYAWFFFDAAKLIAQAYRQAGTEVLRRIVGGYALAYVCVAMMSFTLNYITDTISYLILGVVVVLHQVSRLSAAELVDLGLGEASELQANEAS